jgi:small subunit ribosomal protein S1
VSITKTWLVVNFGENLEGIVHATDVSWEESPKKSLQKYQIGDDVKAVVLAIDPEKGRINLGIKNLESDPFEETFKSIKQGSTVTCTVKAVNHSGLQVELGKGVEAFIEKSELSSDKVEQRPDRFAVGDRVDAQVTKLDKVNRTVNLSIKALELAEQKKKISEYGSVSSGASLGDILGKAINITEKKKEAKSKSKAAEDDQEDSEKKPKAKTTKTKSKKA